MTCAFCGALNSALDHRCTRCGRKLYAADERPVAATRNSTVLAVEFERRPENAPVEQPPSRPVQQPLFSGKEPARESLRLVQMPARTSAPKAHSYRKPGPRQEQPRLEFPQPAPPKIADERSAGGKATVAMPMHRFVASALDASMVAMGLGMLFIVLHLAGVDLVLDKAALPFVGAAVAVAMLFYRLLWCVAGTDSIGMRWAGLRLTNFDGRRPDRGERIRRLVTSLISLGAAGLGLAWALVDEERLTWHDHMSKTFPSPKH